MPPWASRHIGGSQSLPTVHRCPQGKAVGNPKSTTDDDSTTRLKHIVEHLHQKFFGFRKFRHIFRVFSFQFFVLPKKKKKTSKTLMFKSKRKNWRNTNEKHINLCDLQDCNDCLYLYNYNRDYPDSLHALIGVKQAAVTSFPLVTSHPSHPYKKRLLRTHSARAPPANTHKASRATTVIDVRVVP